MISEEADKSEVIAKLQLNPKYTMIDNGINALLMIPQRTLLIITGEQGWGKSLRVERYLDKTIPEDYVFLSSRITPMQLYMKLYEHKDKKVIVFDDIDGIGDKIIISLLKQACWNATGKVRKVNWFTTSDLLVKSGVKEEFTVTSKIILIFNNDKANAEFKPVLDRGRHIKINFSYDEKIREFERLYEELKDTEDYIDKEVLDYIKAFTSPATINLSIRKLILISDEKKYDMDWKTTAMDELKIDEERQMFLDILIKNKCKGKMSAKIIKELERKIPKKQRTFYYWFEEYKDYLMKSINQGKAIRSLERIEEKEEEDSK